MLIDFDVKNPPQSQQIVGNRNVNFCRQWNCCFALAAPFKIQTAAPLIVDSSCRRPLEGRRGTTDAFWYYDAAVAAAAAARHRCRAVCRTIPKFISSLHVQPTE
jgi:hypothetical protein